MKIYAKIYVKYQKVVENTECQNYILMIIFNEQSITEVSRNKNYELINQF